MMKNCQKTQLIITNSLKIGYLMDEWVMKNLYEQFTDEMKAAYDKKYDELIYELWKNILIKKI